jgi:hypothetical protein
MRARQQCARTSSYLGLPKKESQAGMYIEASTNKMPPISQTVAPVNSVTR